MHQNCRVLLFLITFSYSKSSFVSETGQELAVILGTEPRKSEELPVTRCHNNSECPAGDVCERFFEVVDNSTFSFKGDFCTEKPRLDYHVELGDNSADRKSVRRCGDSRGCEQDEICLLSNSARFHGGYCVKLNICSRSRPAFLVYGHECTRETCAESMFPVPGNTWKCVEHNVSEHFLLAFSTVNSEDIRRRRVRACCSEPSTAQCRFGTPVSPEKTCSRHSDCFRRRHEATEWCDEETRFCCEDVSDDASIQCPHIAMYPFVENKCTSYTGNLVTSGRCEGSSDGVNGTCLFGHCCPVVTKTLFKEKADDDQELRNETTFVEKTVFTYKHSFESNVPCDPNQPLRRIRSAFCDPLTLRIVLLSQETSKKMLAEAGEDVQPCWSSYDCPLSNDVCFWGHPPEDVADENVEHQGSCIRNPMRLIPVAVTFDSAAYILIVTIPLILVFSILTYFSSLNTNISKNR